MASVLTFVRSLHYDAIRSVLLVQSGPIDLAVDVATRLRTLFPGCEIHGVIRDDDRDAAAAAGLASMTVVRWEDRFEVVRRLRRDRWDAVVVLFSNRGSEFLRLLPYALRTRTILVFNDHLDYFPLHATRLGTLVRHLGGQASLGGALRWLVGRVVVLPAATVFLIASVARIRARAALRRETGSAV
jgi:hypothetical protein